MTKIERKDKKKKEKLKKKEKRQRTKKEEEKERIIRATGGLAAQLPLRRRTK